MYSEEMNASSGPAELMSSSGSGRVDGPSSSLDLHTFVVREVAEGYGDSCAIDAVVPSATGASLERGSAAADVLFYVGYCCQSCWEAAIQRFADGRHLCTGGVNPSIV